MGADRYRDFRPSAEWDAPSDRTLNAPLITSRGSEGSVVRCKQIPAPRQGQSVAYLSAASSILNCRRMPEHARGGVHAHARFV